MELLTPQQIMKLAYDHEAHRLMQPPGHAPALEVQDLRFTELIRLRRALRRTKWWQHRQRAALSAQINAILTAQKETHRAR